jgi:hypothetical protein
MAAETPATPESVTIAADGRLARECLSLAQNGDESARSSALTERLRGLGHPETARLAVLVREELGSKEAQAAAVPPQGDPHAAWLLNFLHAKSSTLAFDLAADGRFVRWIEPGKKYRFRHIGGGEIVVRIDGATLDYDSFKRWRNANSRIYLRKVSDGDYSNSPGTDPKGPPSGSYRVGRGGCWSDDAQDCRSANRGSGAPDDRSNCVGFRLALTPRQ